LIKVLVCELLQRRNKEWNYFLFWNEFQIDVQLEDKKSPSSRKYSTPRSGKRKRRSISPVAFDHPSPSSKPRRTKKKLEFSKEAEKAVDPLVNKRVLNLLYIDSEEEEHQFEIGNEEH
jgi:hypothetical protein